MLKERIKIDRTTLREQEIICGALVGLAVIALVQMLSLNSLDVSLKVSVFSFAISIPALCAGMLCSMDEVSYEFRPKVKYIALVLLIGLLASLVGICGLFFHFTLYAGITFSVASVIAFVLAWRYTDELKRVNAP